MQELIENTGGIQPSLFVPDNVFNTLILKQIGLLRNPSIYAIDKCFDCITKSIEKVAEITFDKYPRLKKEVVQICNDHLRGNTEKAKNFTKDYLTNEESYVNTNHPEFVERYEVAADMFKTLTIEGNTSENQKESASDCMVYMPNTTSGDTSSAFGKLMRRYNDGEELATKLRADNEAELVLKLVIHYFCIVRGQLVDVLLKAVMRYMVRDLNKELGSLLLKLLYTTDDNIAPLVLESESMRRKRKSSSKMMAVLKQAETLVSDIAMGKE